MAEFECLNCGQELESVAIEHTYKDCETYIKTQNIVCPFCNTGGFDKEGLKYHLNNSCELY